MSSTSPTPDPVITKLDKLIAAVERVTALLLGQSVASGTTLDLERMKRPADLLTRTDFKLSRDVAEIIAQAPYGRRAWVESANVAGQSAAVFPPSYMAKIFDFLESPDFDPQLLAPEEAAYLLLNNEVPLPADAARELLNVPPYRTVWGNGPDGLLWPNLEARIANNLAAMPFVPTWGAKQAAPAIASTPSAAPAPSPVSVALSVIKGAPVPAGNAVNVDPFGPKPAK